MELIKIKNGIVELDSRAIANHFSKQHTHVMRDIKDEIFKLEQAGLEHRSIFGENFFKDSYGRKQPCFILTKEGALQIAARYDAVARRKLIMEIERLEKQNIKPLSPMEMLRLQHQVLDEHNERLTNLEDTMTIDYGQQQELQNFGKAKVIGILGGKDSAAYKDKSVSKKAFMAIWKDYKDYFAINSYKNTPRKDLDKGKEYIQGWVPSGKLQREIESLRGQVRLEAVK